MKYPEEMYIDSQIFAGDMDGSESNYKKPIYKIFQTKVTKITIDRFRVLFSFETLDQNKYNSERTMEAFGETVFLTREEAEKALKEMEEKHE